ncbi:MAG: FtsW/RodA/SpoVE family cell cycle protein [Chloroflexota bacterium]|nr:FtsW/RodA/SpoVE family cell cycle protein [Dehalococcoidia bacterium]MDW8252403.1 FtsW/RodA/SpoVE family cell cycle protein [Chloroflexota bacterium]
MTLSWRGREIALLLTGGAVGLCGAALASAARNGEVLPAAMVPVLAYLGAAIAVHSALSIAGTRGDQLLLPIVVTLSSIGLVFISRLDAGFGMRQTIWLVLGLAVAAATFFLTRRLSVLRQFKYSIATLGLILVGLTFLFGQDLNGSGARLWLGAGGIYFQPSELLKVLLVIFLAAYLDEHATILARGSYRLGPLPLPPIPYLIPLLVMWGLAVGLLVIQRDLGAALLFFGIFVAMLYVASGRLLYLAFAGAAFATAVWVAYHTVPVFQSRVVAWLDPWGQPSGVGMQSIQALIALASGGVFGTGVGLGRPGYVPAVHTDFILVAIGEEAGLAFTLGLLALYAVFIGRGFRIALQSRTTFAALLAAGLVTVIGIQTVVIVGGVLRLLPLTGVTLPFVSYGGSSILTNSVLLGLLLRLAADTERER